MSYPVYPAAFGELRPSIRGLSVEGAKARLVTEYDDGVSRMRRRALVDTTKFSDFAIPRFPLTMLGTFQAFVRDDLNAGSRRFTALVVQSDGSTATRVCRIERGPSYTYPATALAAATFDLLVWGWR